MSSSANHSNTIWICWAFGLARSARVNGIPISLIHPAISLSGYFMLVSDESSGKNQAHQAHEGVIFVLLLATPTVVLVALELLAHTAVISHGGRVARHDSLRTYHQARGLLSKWIG